MTHQEAASFRDFNKSAANTTLTKILVIKKTRCLVVVAGLGSSIAVAHSHVATLAFKYSEANGIGTKQGVMNRWRETT